MKKTGTFGAVVLLLVVVSGSILSAQVNSAKGSRIVGVWDVQVKVLTCDTKVEIASFPGLHKYESGFTAQVVPATNPAALSPHVGIWRYVKDDMYQLTFKMFTFDAAGNNTGWVVVKSDVVISPDATAYAGAGKAQAYDVDGNPLGASCPTFSGTRFQ